MKCPLLPAPQVEPKGERRPSHALAAAMERAMKVQEVICRVLAGTLSWLQGADILSPQTDALRSLSTTVAALRPGRPLTYPPGWLPLPQM